MAIFQDAEKDILYQVFAGRPVGRLVHEVAEQRLVMAVEQHFQPGDVAGPDFKHDLFVLHVPPFT